MLQNNNKIKIIKIDWIDPQLLEMQGLSYPEDLEGIKLQKCSIVGHLIKETKDTYFIAKELWENGAFKYIHMIPKKIVENIKTLK